MSRVYHADGTQPTDASAIFVFGSNLRGAHGAGAARAAFDHYDAAYGVGFGLSGRSFAIPTKDSRIETMPLADIKPHVDMFIDFAKTHPEMRFFVTRIGCGLAGYSDADIAPMFKDAPDNCDMPESWAEYL
jgi:hypothetical protein